MNTLKSRLRDFKLSGIYNSLEDRISYAHEKSLSHIELLELLFEDETNNRMNNSYNKRYAKAKLPSHKTLEDFDFSFQPSIDKKIINDCATCNFIKEKKNIVFIGNPGAGKTHLSIAIGVRALMKGSKVYFTSVAEMLQSLNASRADNSYYQKVAFYLAPDLLILDELGFKKLPGYSADDFFEIISKRYEKGSVIITTNKAFEQWGDIVADNVLASAIIDRIAHHSTVIKIDGPSYRAKNLKKEGGDKG
ncbi:MAG: IS21-like element helper ATPase IstB [Candidatus Omnitrophota bacterium]